jgi:hypothetical protein
MCSDPHRCSELRYGVVLCILLIRLEPVFDPVLVIKYATLPQINGVNDGGMRKIVGFHHGSGMISHPNGASLVLLRLNERPNGLNWHY